MFASTSEPRTKTDCSTGSTFRYQRREPEKTLLHRIVRAHLATFLADAAERYPSGDIPAFILPAPVARIGAHLPQLPPTLALVAGLNLALDRILPRDLLRPQATMATRGGRTRAISPIGKTWINGSTLSVRFISTAPSDPANAAATSAKAENTGTKPGASLATLAAG